MTDPTHTSPDDTPAAAGSMPSVMVGTAAMGLFCFLAGAVLVLVAEDGTMKNAAFAISQLGLVAFVIGAYCSTRARSAARPRGN